MKTWKDKTTLYKNLTEEIDQAINSLNGLRRQANNQTLDSKQIDRVARDVALMTSVMKDIAYQIGQEVRS